MHAITTARKLECEADGVYFNRYFLKQRGSRMIVGRHHSVMQNTLDRVYSGEIRRLIITLPPGYTKTEMALIGFTARGLALYPYSRFMHLTYSDTLTRLSSSTTRNTILTPEYQAMWPTKIRNDTNAKNMWWTNNGGGVYATTPFGQVTGFRAGYMQDGFSGALMIDDPIKPRDALSKTKRTALNDAYSDTVSSRLAIEAVPVVLIMQRVDYDDLAGFLLRGGSGETWHHLNMPVLIGKGDAYPAENTHGIEIDHGLPEGWLWPVKHNDEHLVALRSHKRKWNAQMMQAPRKFDVEGSLWKTGHIEAARNRATPWRRKRCVIAVDPAVSSNADSDLTGIGTAMSYTDGSYSVNRDLSGRYSPREWALVVINEYERVKADAVVVEKNNGGDLLRDNLRNNGFKGHIILVHAATGKFARAEPVLALYEEGNEKVYHDPKYDLSELEAELMEYAPSTSAASPNRLDWLVWALTDLAGIGSTAAAVW